MIAVIARGARSALGAGAAASAVGRAFEPARACVARDDELASAGLERPFAARARIQPRPGVDRATALVELALAECARELDASLPGWRQLRVGAAIGTSSGGMRSFERLLAPGAAGAPSALAATYIGPLVLAARPVAFEPVSLVLAACASSTIAVGLGRAWLLEDRCDVAICGGFDAVSVFVAAGFESLRATCGAGGPRPFRSGRDGLALGEGAAVLALARGDRARAAQAWVTGFGASCDATHLTAPDPTGAGLARAATAALVEAGRPSIGLVSAHGTATAQNDAAEAAAITRALANDAAGSGRPAVFSMKGTIGHTLGAAGALELLAAVDALGAGVAPATAGEGVIEGGLRVLDRAEPSSARAALKLSAAFGGANAALVVTLDDPRRPGGQGTPGDPPRHARAVHVSRASGAGLADVDPARLATRTGYSADRIARADDLVRLAMAAVAPLEEAHGGRGALAGAGIVVGHGLATVETNARFFERILSAGAPRAEARRFPYTSPNAAAGECAVAFGLTGPAFAVGGGPHGGIEALGVAAELVRTGAASRMVVVAVDAPGELAARLTGAAALTSGAVALLVAPDATAARLDAWTTRLEPGAVEPPRLPPIAAYRALQPLARPGAAGTEVELQATLPWGGRAYARLTWC